MQDRNAVAQLSRGGHVLHLFVLAAVLTFPAHVIGARPGFGISDDRDLKEIDLSAWDCLNRLEGSAKTPDGIERNRLKNRSAPDGLPSSIKSLDTTGFLKLLSEFDAQTKRKRRKDLSPAEHQMLEPLEGQIVQLTGYLMLAYCGPTESTNCGSLDPHDWHLEVFEKPADHAPQPGDPTPIVCEITPRTQNAIFHDNVRIQELTAFFRRADLEVEPTGHKAVKIRLTGYLLWDDEHNGSADVGTTIERVGANRYHNPWRSTAWEIHPVFKIERLDGGPTPLTQSPQLKPTTPLPHPSEILAPPTATQPANLPQFVTILQPVQITIPYGVVTLPRGTRFPLVSRDGESVVIRYMDGTYAIPANATDLH